jgi:enamine deaminase RidA (YjgF/YER057c/UK114 family)
MAATRRHFSPEQLRAPFGRYHHAVELGRPERWLVLSGLLAVRPDGSVPEDAEEQARVILACIDACLAEAGMGRADVVRLTTYITEPEHRPAYMRARDAWVADPPPASTLVVVKALALPACKVEIEAIAAR